MQKEYNLIVIGAGPSGIQAALKAALFGHPVAVVDGGGQTEGLEVNPREKLREMILRLISLNEAYQSPDRDDEAYQEQVRAMFFDPVLDGDVIETLKSRNLHMRNIDYVKGDVRFLNIDEVEVNTGTKTEILEGRKFVIATGSHPGRMPNVPYDGGCVHDLNTIFTIAELPETLVINGAGEMGVQFAILFNQMGVQVTLLCEEESLFSELDQGLVEALTDHLTEQGIALSCRESVSSAMTMDGEKVAVTTTRGTQIECGMLLETALRVGNTESLETQMAEIELTDDGFIKTNDHFRTNIPHIYAIGEVVHASYASLSKEQGRAAVSYMFGLTDVEQLAEGFPTALMLFPEIASYGMTEADVKKSQKKYVQGMAAYSDIHLGVSLGVEKGFLKLLVDRETESILGVHILGNDARELIHFGMSLVEERVAVGKVIGTVLNEDSFHELYRIACLDAVYKLRGRGR